MIMIQRFFIVLTLGVIALAWLEPAPLNHLMEFIPALISIGSFLIGLVLRPHDFVRLLSKPMPLAISLSLLVAGALFLSWSTELIRDDSINQSMIISTSLYLPFLSYLLALIAKADVTLAVLLAFISLVCLSLLTTFLGFTQQGQSILQAVMFYLMLPITFAWLIKRINPIILKPIYAYIDDIILCLSLMSSAIIIANIKMHAIDFTLTDTIIILFILLLAIFTYFIAGPFRCTITQKRAMALGVMLTSGFISVQLCSLGLLAHLTLSPNSLIALALTSATVIATYWKWNTERAIKTARS